MSIVRYKPTVIPPTQPQLPIVQPEHYKGVVVDDKYQSLHSLTAYAEGFPQTIDYYGQIVGDSNDIREIDPAQSGVYQQYTKINGLDIRVDSPLTMQYNDDTGLSSITGSAFIYPDIIPNTYDYFTYRTTRGKLSLFRITNVTRKSMNRDSLHAVEYQMVGYVDQAGDAKIMFDSLESKVSRQYYFHGDRLVEGKSPLLKSEDHENIGDLQNDYRNILSY
ncbi:MAG TPA: hypothetical protein VN843_00655, partial [Anaerolineales bacterium]|nr:hypothetical protein [Anaerolineales bacterium]